MLAYIVRRAATGVVMLFVMSLIVFLLFFSGGLEPARFACGKNCSPQLEKVTARSLGYDKAPIVQWGEFVKGVFVGRQYPLDEKLRAAAPDQVVECKPGCLGYSLVSTATVNSKIKDALPISASLALAAFVMWIIGGVLFGILAALYKGSFLDRAVVGTALVAYSFPTFWVGSLLLSYVAIRWQILPVPSYTPIAEGGPFNWMAGLFLPGLTLALFYMAGYVRMTRAFVLESMGEDYMRTAKAKGLPAGRVVFKHALRAALTPLVTMAGLDLASLLGGAIITEAVFNYNGLGKLAVVATQQLDLPILIGLVIMLATFVILANIVVDLLYAVIDPRVRVG